MERIKRIQLRVSEHEHEQFRALARRRSMRLANFVRTAILHGHPPAIPEINRQALADLQRIGGNLNQLARHLNSGGELTDADTLNELRAQASALRAALAGARAE